MTCQANRCPASRDGPALARRFRLDPGRGCASRHHRPWVVSDKGHPV